MVRCSLDSLGWLQRKKVTADLRMIYNATVEDKTSLRLTEFGGKWDTSSTQIDQSWQRN